MSTYELNSDDSKKRKWLNDLIQSESDWNDLMSKKDLILKKEMNIEETDVKLRFEESQKISWP